MAQHQLTEDGGSSLVLGRARQRARAIVTFAGRINYRMPGDTNAQLIRMELPMLAWRQSAMQTRDIETYVCCDTNMRLEIWLTGQHDRVCFCAIMTSQHPFSAHHSAMLVIPYFYSTIYWPNSRKNVRRRWVLLPQCWCVWLDTIFVRSDSAKVFLHDTTEPVAFINRVLVRSLRHSVGFYAVTKTDRRIYWSLL